DAGLGDSRRFHLTQCAKDRLAVLGRQQACLGEHDGVRLVKGVNRRKRVAEKFGAVRLQVSDLLFFQPDAGPAKAVVLTHLLTTLVIVNSSRSPPLGRMGEREPNTAKWYSRYAARVVVAPPRSTMGLT